MNKTKKIIEDICKSTKENYKDSKTNDILTTLENFKKDVAYQAALENISTTILKDIYFDAIVSPYRQELKENLERFNNPK